MMASKNTGKGGPVKKLKSKKTEEEDPDDLKTLMEQSDQPKHKTASYTHLNTGQWVTKSEDRQVH